MRKSQDHVFIFENSNLRIFIFCVLPTHIIISNLNQNSILNSFPEVIIHDKENFNERKIANLAKHIKVLSPENNEKMKKDIKDVKKYFSLNYFTSHPRKCFTNGKPTELCGGHQNCWSESIVGNTKKGKIEKAAFEGKVNRKS